LSQAARLLGEKDPAHRDYLAGILIAYRAIICDLIS
jgi:hypothetical protein